MANEIILPFEKIKSVNQNPNNLIIFSKPKVGKTSLLAQLDNCLILDLEKGSDYVDALKMQANSVTDIKNIGTAILNAKRPYKYIAVDTITALEEMCIPLAENLFSKSSMGVNWFKEDGGKVKYGTILNLPNGAGYSWLRQAFESVLSFIKTLAPHIILIGHVKDIYLDKNGSEFTCLDLDLTGKLKRIVTSNSDAIGYLYRKGNKNILSFKTTDEVSCGARPDHLKDKEIEISLLNEENNLITNWDKVFIN